MAQHPEFDAHHLSDNYPAGPHLVVKTFSYSSQADAIKLADKLAAEMLRRPIEELHQTFEQGSFQPVAARTTAGRHDVEMHYRVRS